MPLGGHVKLTEAKASCQVSVTLTGNKSVDEYFSLVVEQLQLQQPQDKAQALTFYKALCEAVEQR